MRGRGGGVEDVLYENLEGSVIAGIQLTENYAKGTQPTNVSATPGIRNSTSTGSLNQRSGESVLFKCVRRAA